MQKNWVLVADEGVARVLEWDTEAASLKEVETLTNAAAHARGAQLRRDAYGRRKASGTRAGGSITESAGKDEEHREAEGFARRVAAWLDEAQQSQRFERLQVAAAPRFLGLLRSQLSAHVSERVCDERNVDLVHLDANELARRLLLSDRPPASGENSGGRAANGQSATGPSAASSGSGPGAERSSARTSTRSSTRPAPNEPFEAKVIDIYARLRRGEGRELVTEDNVQSLMILAERSGHPVLAEELREWGAACGRPQASKLP